VARRLVGLVLALAFGFAAARVHGLERVGAPWLEAWAEQHRGPREPDASALARVADDFAVDRRADLFGLLVALAAAAAAVAAAPRAFVQGRGAVVRLAGLGGVVLGAAAMLDSLSKVSELAHQQRWTVADDSLSLTLGPLTDTVRGWRETVPPDHAVIVFGMSDFLLSRVGWALHPRAVHPVVLPRPEGLDLAALAQLAATLELGRQAPGRWLVDLEALAAGHEALVRIEP
jgi:hypothetical protein